MASVKKLLTMIDQTAVWTAKRRTQTNSHVSFVQTANRLKQLLRKYPECSHNSIHMIIR